MTPPGFVKAALACRAETREPEIRGEKRTIVTVTTPHRHEA
jgi:hypothetical protein